MMMDEDDASEMDMAAQMGFASFGPQDKNKGKKGTITGSGGSENAARSAKRKRSDLESNSGRGQISGLPATMRHALPAFNPATSIVPTGTEDIDSSFGAPSDPTGDAQTDPVTVSEILDTNVPGDQAGFGAEARVGGFGPGPGLSSQRAYGGQQQQQRGGRYQNNYGNAANVKTNEMGDPIYYDPSFIEDPWAKLTPKPWGNR